MEFYGQEVAMQTETLRPGMSLASLYGLVLLASIVDRLRSYPCPPKSSAVHRQKATKIQEWRDKRCIVPPYPAPACMAVNIAPVEKCETLVATGR